jgi:hypothetical protein
MARGILERELSGALLVELSVVPDPSIEAGDVVWLDLPSIRRQGLFVVASVHFTLGDEADDERITVRTGVLT